MAKAKKKRDHGPLQADVSHGADWLHQLTESQLRDEVLKDLFVNMKKEGAIDDYIYTHGPHEHGVDWVVLEKGGLSQRFVGIQAKSKPLTRQGDSTSESALAVKQQCLSAYDHLFNWHGNNIRLDVVELWMSGHLTSEAEAEFGAPLGPHRISVKKSDAIFLLLEKFCPRVVSKIPGLAESGYVMRMANPPPLTIRVLGVPLNPKKHFIELRFSRHPEFSLDRVFDQRTRKVREEAPLYLEDILSASARLIIVGPELGGKSYLLKRIACIAAERDHLPVIIDVEQGNLTGPISSPHLLREHLSWYSVTSLQNADAISRKIFLLIDNADKLTDEQIEQLRESSHKKITLILAGRKSRSIAGFVTYYISGVRTGALQGFIRSLDIDSGSTAGLMERATQYIQRTIGVSGLPANPFTVSIMLEECRISRKRLATPTMGRLIERFVQGQLGSHSDTTRVDYETKDQFLTAIGGKRATSFSVVGFRKSLGRFIAVHGHAHLIEDFEQDLVDTGLLESIHENGVLRWTHPIFRDFFWVRNLVQERKYKVLTRILQAGNAQAIAAIAGSQMGNAHKVLAELLQSLPAKDWMRQGAGSRYLLAMADSDDVLPSDIDEEKMLSMIEASADAVSEEDQAPKKSLRDGDGKVTLSDDQNVRKALAFFASKCIEEKHSLIVNVSALLLNARHLPREDKLAGVLCIVRSNARLTRHLSEAIQGLKPKGVDQFLADLFSTFIGLTVNDRMIGDAFLAEIFKERFKKAASGDEKLFVMDLMVASGVVDPMEYLEVLREKNDLADTVAVYLRLVSSYYYRFHKKDEKARLKQALKEVRKQAKGVRLTPVS